MRGKLMLASGLAVGYVLGSRAGRARYEQIKKAAGNFWRSGPVQNKVHSAGDFAKDKAPEVVDFVSDNVKKVVSKSKSPKSRSSSSTTASTSN
ncbi:hypothetical protein [Marisediminicola sp. LYQ134]|uniref:hypothetical protein n=1 Tax=unclassified Marisediminicola TaxID=2618316 RepID=UPI0039832FD0